MPLSTPAGDDDPNRCHWCKAIFNNPTQRLRHEDRCGPQFQGGGGPTTDFKTSLDPLNLSFAILKNTVPDPFASQNDAKLPPPPPTTAEKIKGAMRTAGGALGRGLEATGQGVLDAGSAALSGAKKVGEGMDRGAESLVNIAAGTSLPSAPAMPAGIAPPGTLRGDVARGAGEAASSVLPGAASHINQGQGMNPIHRVLGTGEYGPEGSARDPLDPNYERRIGLTGVVSNTFNRLNPFGGGHKLRASKTNVPGAHVSQGKDVPKWLKNRQKMNYVDRAVAAGLPIEQYRYAPPPPTGGNP